MIVRTDQGARRPPGSGRAPSLFALALLVGCGSDKTTLVIANEHGSVPAEITQVLTRPCLHRYWDPNEPELDPSRDLPAEGRVTIPHGDSREFELAPGCHDFTVTRDGKTARARVLLDVGESATWVPFQIEENKSWWCHLGECDE